MRILKLFSSFLLLLVVLLAVFYFWARKPLMEETDYSEIDQFSTESNQQLKDTFSVVTYNIGYLSGMTNNLPVKRPQKLFTSNLKDAVGLISNQNPDIIVFQEIDFNSSRSSYVDQYQRLAALNAYSYGATSVNWDKQYVPFPYWPLQFHFGEMLSGQAVLSNTKILSNIRLVLPKPASNPFYYNDFYLERLAQLVWVETKNDSLLLINVHFEAWDAPTRELQAEIVLDIFKKYENDHPIVLLGDFNCTPPYIESAYQEKTIEVLLKHPSISSVIEKHDYLRNPEMFYTFNSGKPFEKIDYIFYNNRYLNCLESRVLQGAGNISDHLPLSAVLSFKPQN